MTPTATASATWKTQIQVGINGTSTSDFNMRATTTNWSSTTAATTNTDYCSQTVSLVPANGLTFTWTPPPTIDVTPASLTFVEGVGVTSSPQNVTVQGYGLTSSSVTVTAPTNYEIYNGSAWVTSMTIPVSTAAVGTYVNTVVPTHFIAPSTAAAYPGTLTFASTGATTANVTLNGYATVPCSGAPTPGTSSVSPTIGGATTPFTLSLSGYTVAGGITFQWQSSPDNVTWTNISGATTIPYTVSGITSNQYYRCQLTCSSSTSSSSSCMATFLAAPGCTPSYYYSGASAYGLNNFSLTGYSGSNINDNGLSPHPSSGYEDMTSIASPVNLMQGSSYSGTASYTPSYYYYQNQVWIDFDNDGTFATSEQVTPVFGLGGCYSMMSSDSYTLSIPATAPVGYHRMRVRNAMTYSCSNSTAMDPCYYYDYDNYYYYGISRDYVVNIVPLPVCSGVPSGISVTASQTFGCTTYSSSLGVTGITASGYTYQWQSSPDSLTWSGVSGATSTSYTASVSTTTYYRCVITCSASSSSMNTAGVKLLFSATAPIPYSESFEGITTNNTLPPCMDATNLGYLTRTYISATGYDNMAGHTGTKYGTFRYGCDDWFFTPGFALTAGSTYVFSFWYVTDGYTGWNTLQAKIGTSQTASGMTAIIGTPVISPSNTTYAQYTATVTATSTGTFYIGINCQASYSPDYLTIDDINMTQLPACSGTLSGIAPTATQTFGCSTYSSTVSLTGISSSGLTYQWESSPDSLTWTSVAGATTSTYAASVSTSVYYRCIVTCAASSSTLTTAGLHLVFSATVALPYTESFEGIPSNNTLPPCMDATNLGYLTRTFTNPTGYDNMAGRTGSKYACFRYGCNDWFFTPGFAVTAGNTYVVSFWYVTDGYYGWNTLQAMVGTSQTSSGMTAIVGTPVSAPSNTTYAQYTGTFTATSTGTLYMGINCIASYSPDYLTIDDINVTQLPMCPGTPSGISVASTQTYGCSPYSPVLSLAGVGYSGYTYQWESSPDSTTWTAVSGATNASYSPSVSTNVYYRAIVTCSAGGTSLTTAGLQLIYSPTVPLPYTESFEGIASNNTLPPCMDATNLGSYTYTYTSSTGYYNQAARTGSKYASFQWGANDWFFTPGFSLTAGGTYVFSFWYVTDGYYGWNALQASFGTSQTVAGMTTPIGTAVTSPSNTTYAQYTGTFTATSTGTFYIGINCNASYYPAYLTIDDINVVQLPPCSGTPTAGTATSTISSGCGTVTPNLSLTGSTSGVSGLGYQWQSSPDGTTWSNVAGATTNTYAPAISATTYYRNEVSCASASAMSASTLVSLNPVPADIDGGYFVCLGGTTSLSSTTAGGTWTSSDATTVSVDASGVATGVAAGTAAISYTLPTGCGAVTVMNVNTVVPTASASPSSPSICSGGSVSFNATPTSTLPNYDMATIPYSFTTQTSPTTITTFTSMDDGYAPITLPFSFDFFGSSYTTAYVGTNGYISFGYGSSSNSTWYMPTSYMPPLIAYTMNDVIITSMGSITYSTEGTAPNRVFVVSFNKLSTYGYSSDDYDAQIKLYETTNTIDVLVNNATWDYHSMGIQDGGSQALTPAGRNDSYYGISPSAPEAYRFFVPQDAYTWSPSTYLASTTGATVTATGLTGSSTAVYTVTRTYNGCGSNAAATVTLNPLPATITGTSNVCQGLTTALGTMSSGGTWQSSTPATATVDAATGVVTGVVPGTSEISYTFTSTGCSNSQVVTVNSLPADIIGTAAVCSGSTTTLTDATPFGTWGSGTPAVAAVNSVGEVTGGTAGVAMITYTLPTGCIKTREATVNPLPTINVTPASTPTICEGEGTAFSVSSPTMEFSLINQDFNSGLGFWTIATPSDPADGISPWVLTSTPLSGSGDGSALVEANPAFGTGATVTETILTSPGFSTVGYGSADLTFNQNLASTSSADMNVEVQYSIDGGSTWSLLLDQMNVTSGGTTWSASAPEVSVALPAAALNVPDVRLRWYYKSNFGLWWQVDNIAVKAALPAATFTWAGVGGATGLSCTSCASPTITPTASGANVYNVTASSTCSSNTNVTINVNPLPGVITSSAATLCVGNTNTLSSPDAGGTWTSSDVTKATIDPVTGEVAGIAVGTTVISYTLPTTCARTMTLNVDAAPAPIVGTLDVCEGSTTSLSHPVTGGAWAASSSTVATIDPTTGVVSGVNPGVLTITDYLPSGCRVSAEVTVNALPSAITGTPVVCEGLTTSLSSGPTGGAWSSDDATIATVVATGDVTGVLGGTANIVYTLPITGCARSVIVTVNSNPADILGTLDVCVASTTSLSSSTTAGTWSSSTPAVGTVDMTTGVLSGITAGVTSITYTLPTGCLLSMDATVNALPAPLTGVMDVCIGLSTSLSSTPAGGSWSVATAAPVTIGSSGLVTGMSAGTTEVTYTLATGCKQVAIVTVNALPSAFNVTGSGSYCAGGTGVPVGLSSSESGVSYQLYMGTTPIGSPVVSATTGSVITFGLQTAGTYTVIATNSTSCVADMIDSAVITATPISIPAVTIASTPGSPVCAGTAVTYSATPVNGGTLPVYAWEVNGTPVSGTSATYSYVPVSGDVVKVTLNSNAICATPSTAVYTISTTVNPNETPIATIAFAGSATICAGNSTTLNATSVFGGTAPIYEWFVNGVTTGFLGSSYSYVPASGDVVTCELTSNFTCLTTPVDISNPLTMVVTPVYIPTAGITVAPGTVIAAGTTVTFTAVVTAGTAGPLPTYQWYKGSVAIAGETNVTYTSNTLSNGDSITCKVVGTAPCGEQTFNSVVMQVKTDVRQLSATIGNVRLVPNPNNGEFVLSGTLSTIEDDQVFVEVTNMLGQSVYTGKFIAKGGNINEKLQLSHTLANGMYMLNLRTASQMEVIHFVLEQ
jgi:hypothetical protein